MIVATITLIIGLIVIQIDINNVANEAKKQTYSSEYIEISAINKTESVSGSNYVTEITFNIQNNSIHNITSVSGNMEFYYGEIKLGNGNISFNKDIEASSSDTTTIEFKGYSEVYQKLYETPYENLGLTYQITSILFDNSDNTSTHWQYANSEVKWIKKADPDTPSEMPVKVEAIYLDTYSALIEIGEKIALTATIYPYDATDPSIEWTSSNISVATVDNNGLVTAINEGEAIIYATNVDSGNCAGCNINVYREYSDFYFTSSNYNYHSGINVSRYRGSERVIAIPAQYKAEKVISIGSELFQDYTSLTSITIPDSVEVIGTNAFSGCTSLQSVYYTGTIEEWAQIDFTNYLAK